MAGEITKIKDFKLLPEPIKDWLSSTRITDLISDLNKKLSFDDEERIRVIPTMILRLCLGDLAPQNFLNELIGKLKLNPMIAKSAVQEIFESILRPIEVILRNELNIDLKTTMAEPEIPTLKETGLPPLPPLRVPPPILPRPTPPSSAIASREGGQPPIMKVPINVPKQSPVTERVEKDNLDSKI
ncbi:MAG: hypothetical protein AAB646_00680 [Patescibacteria group bacterium]